MLSLNINALKLFFSVLVVSFLTLTGSLLSAPSAKLVVDEPVHNFGEVFQGESAEHVFVIRNEGDAALKVEDVRSSCGCTAALMDKDEIAPGESAELKAVFNSSRFKGPVSKKIFVHSNDPDYPITTLELKTVVDIDIDVSPGKIFFHGLVAGEEMTRNIKVTNLSDNEISITEISSTVPVIKTELAKMTLAPEESTDLVLRIPVIEKDMRLTGELKIRNTSPQSVVKVMLYGGAIKDKK